VIDLITVVFQQELHLIKIQARSIELNLESHRINKIYVVVDSDDSVADLVDPAWWGINANKVKIIPRSQLGLAPQLDGWSRQQLYKLLAAEQAESEWSMCLDAKTWFVQSLEWDKLFDGNGLVRFRSFPTIDHFKSAQVFLEKFYNIELPHVIGPGGVPFMFRTELVKEMVKDIEQRTGSSFFDWFALHVMEPDRITEFMLYSGYVIHKLGSYSSLYSRDQYYTVTNMADRQVAEEFDLIMGRMHGPYNLTASIQGRAYPHLNDEQLDVWVNFLFSRNLITNPENAKLQLNTLR
jgi:hypothetical protein